MAIRAQTAVAEAFTPDSAFRDNLRSAAFFLFEILLQSARAVVAPEILRAGDERAVARDLVVFDRLCGGNERSVEHLCCSPARGAYPLDLDQG